jgi:hypothetical protein
MEEARQSSLLRANSPSLEQRQSNKSSGYMGEQWKSLSTYEDDTVSFCYEDEEEEEEEEEVLSKSELRGTEFIKDICANHPWLSGVESDSIAYYRCRLLRDPRIRKYQRCDLATFAIYVQARKSGCGISPSSILNITGGDLSKLQKLENIFNNDVADDDPKFYIAELGIAYQLSGSDVAKLRKISDMLQGDCFGCYPRTIAAALLYLYIRSTNKLKISLSSIARNCKLSPASIRAVLPTVCNTLPDNVFKHVFK